MAIISVSSLTVECGDHAVELANVRFLLPADTLRSAIKAGDTLTLSPSRNCPVCHKTILSVTLLSWRRNSNATRVYYRAMRRKESNNGSGY